MKMNSTGIIRRIDDLGRIVIPKEVRRRTGIKEDMPMEVFIGSNNEVILKKYLPNNTIDFEVFDSFMEEFNWLFESGEREQFRGAMKLLKSLVALANKRGEGME